MDKEGEKSRASQARINLLDSSLSKTQTKLRFHENISESKITLASGSVTSDRNKKIKGSR